MFEVGPGRSVGRGKLILVMSFIAMIGLLTVDRYGMTWDEATEVKMVEWNWEFVTQGKPYPIPLIEYYGILFNGIAEFVYQAQKVLQQILDPTQSVPSSPEEIILTKIQVKHVVTFLWSLITYGSVAGIVGIVCGPFYRGLAPIVLALFPRFWGHSFFNPKDIPFAALFTASTWMGIYLINAYLEIGTRKINSQRIARRSILYGVLVGLLSGIRPGGFIILVFVALTYLIVKLSQSVRRSEVQNEIQLVSFYFSLTIVSCFITLFVFYPASWRNPFSWFIAALGSLSSYPLSFVNLFEGHYFPGNAVPWNYIPQWALITTPVIFLLLFIAGVILAGIRYKNLTSIQKAAIILLLFQIFFLPLIAILRSSTLYDEIRHFLFIVPGIAAFSTFALIWVYQKLSRTLFKTGFIVSILVIFLQTIQDMVILHPYEYAYFNHALGGLEAAYRRYETDYWGLSLREATEWLNRNAPSGQHKIEVPGPEHIVDFFARRDFQLVKSKFRPNELETNKESNQQKGNHYYIAIDRFQWQTLYPNCSIAHKVERQGVTLAVVKKCTK